MTLAEEKTAQMRAVARGVSEGPPGAMFWASPTRAKHLMDSAAAELVNPGAAPAATGILRRSANWPLDRFSTVTPGWAGGTVVLIGGGPSLTMADLVLVNAAQRADAVRVIAINDAYLWAPWADILYAADSSWWLDHARGIAKPMLRLSADAVRTRFAAFPGERCGIQNSGMNVEDPRVHLIRSARADPRGQPIHSTGLSLDPAALTTGSNSGWQALNLVVLAGAKTAILLGYDGRPAADGRTHWSGGHAIPTPEAAYALYRQSFSAGENALKEAGVRVINASPGTAIDTFEKLALVDALKLCA